MRYFGEEGHSSQRAARALQTLDPYDAVVPITRLPAEILLLIFSILNKIHPAGPGRSASKPTDLGWIAVSHVCRAWRTIAMDGRNLWGEIALPLGETWVEEMIARASFAPLVISDRRCAYGYRWSPLQHERIGEHIGHTKSLELMSDFSPSLISRALARPAPILWRLSLLYSRHNPSFRIPDFPGNHAPFLAHLSLKNIHVPWTSPVLNNLVRLVVDFPMLSNDHPILDEVLSALDTMHALEVLHLHHYLPRYTHSSAT
ncbi:hypothetical protein BV25DRAFT_1652293 [Artomyces pyxidatus]|uniref:Uncharacterized protein n=1 Tax=Artomyces pyxidatus TaxID=48021 RepID=A0ACB8SIA7_9AGAM|nr:hypothetical protein BV25DRAFT_1652293 [Artomyces pyxidatus]